jgi:hypothetical protein
MDQTQLTNQSDEQVEATVNLMCLVELQEVLSYMEPEFFTAEMLAPQLQTIGRAECCFLVKP